METRIRQVESGVYVIDEQVIPSGNHRASGSYITWPMCFVKKENAEEAVTKAKGQ